MRHVPHSVYNVVRIRQHQTRGPRPAEESAPLQQDPMTRGAGQAGAALLREEAATLPPAEVTEGRHLMPRAVSVIFPL